MRSLGWTEIEDIAILKHSMSLKIKILLASIAVFGVTTQASTYHGPVSAALGGSGRSAVIPGETTLNPALISHIQGYHATISYRDYSLDPVGNQSTVRASLIDSNTENLVPAAFTFGQTNDDQEFHLSVSKFIFSKFSIGLDFQRYLSNPRGGHKDIENDVTFGVIWAPTADWGLAFVANNINRTNLPQLDQSMGIATSYSYKSIARLQVDVLYPTQNNDDGQTVVMAGIESHFVVGFPFRMGYRQDSVTDTSFWTVGQGWIGPKLAVDYAFEKNVKSNKESAHSIDLRIYF